MTTPVFPASLWRRLAALMYDGLLLCALLFVTAGVLSPLFIWLELPTDTVNGVLVPSRLVQQTLTFPLLCLLVWGFYTWFWTHGGQTLGMHTWRLRAVRSSGAPMGWRHSTLRMLAGVLTWMLLGLGYLPVLLGKPALHDWLSGTRVVVLPPKPKRR